MTVPAFRDKFVGFVDILGFKDLVEAAEHGASGNLGDLIGLMQDLGTTADKSAVDKNGPSACPTSQRLAFNVDFELTQVSDCVVVSAEISPGGVLQVIDHCWLAATKLLTKGVAVRGFITRGSVLHEGNTILGTGYQNAYARERGVTAFKIEAEERGTPFIEIDGTVTKYIQTETDPCVREMVERMTESDGEISAIYPFKSFVHSYVISGGNAPSILTRRRRRIITSACSFSASKQMSKSAPIQPARKLRPKFSTTSQRWTGNSRRSTGLTNASIGSVSLPHQPTTEIERAG